MAPAPSRFFEYAVWFRNPRLARNDEDYEWPAVFAIEADTALAAQAWGDHLARSYAARSDEIFIGSAVEPLLDETQMVERTISDRPMMPVVSDGHEATDDEIGW